MQASQAGAIEAILAALRAHAAHAFMQARGAACTRLPTWPMATRSRRHMHACVSSVQALDRVDCKRKRAALALSSQSTFLTRAAQWSANAARILRSRAPTVAARYAKLAAVMT